MGSYFSYNTGKKPTEEPTDILLKNLSQLLKSLDRSKLTEFQKDCLQNLETELLTNALTQKVQQIQDIVELRDFVLREQERYVNVLTCFSSLLVDMSPKEMDDFEFLEIERAELSGIEGKLDLLVRKGLEDDQMVPDVVALWMECFMMERDLLELVVEEYPFIVTSRSYVEHPKRVMSRVKFWENHLFKKIEDVEMRKKIRDERSGFILRCSDKVEAEKVISRALTMIKQQEDDQKMHLMRSRVQNELKLALAQVRQKVEEETVSKINDESPVTDSWSSESSSSSEESSISPKTTRSSARQIPTPTVSTYDSDTDNTFPDTESSSSTSTSSESSSVESESSESESSSDQESSYDSESSSSSSI